MNRGQYKFLIKMERQTMSVWVNGKRRESMQTSRPLHTVYTLHCVVFFLLCYSHFTQSDSHPGVLAVCPQMPILKLRWSILGPKDLSIQWRSLLSRPAWFSMISSARRSPVKPLNPSQVRLLLPLAALSCRRNSPEFYMKNVWVSGKSFTESTRN